MDIAEDPISDLPQAMDTSESGAHNPSVAASNLIETARAHEIEERTMCQGKKRDSLMPLMGVLRNGLLP
ncbi:hypothetical protein ACFX13_013616 [Malus domestica]